MTVQDIVNSTSNDIRGLLSTTAPDANIFIPWVDRIHKDALHTSVFNYMIQSVENINVVSGTSSYTLTTPARRILLVYDRTFDRVLTPVDDLGYPTQKADASPGVQSPVPQSMLSISTMEQWPEYYRRIGDSNVYIFPAPQKTAFNGTYEIHYEGYAPNLIALTDTLLIPDDGKDLVAAGVNMLACQFLKLDAEVQTWAQLYESMKKGTAQS